MLQKTQITVKRRTKTSSEGSPAVEVETTVFEGLRRVVFADNRGTENRSTVQGLDFDYDYLVYMQVDDPELRYGDIIEFDLQGQKQVVVNKIRPMTITIQGKTTEVFCRYN